MATLLYLTAPNYTLQKAYKTILKMIAGVCRCIAPQYVRIVNKINGKDIVAER